MTYIACSNHECLNFEAPYARDPFDPAAHPCPLCGTTMTAVDAPTVGSAVVADPQTQDQAATSGLANGRAAVSTQIKALLAESDVWVIRSIEDGVSLSDTRKTYRLQLRAALASAAAATDPASITIPEIPAA